MTAPLPDLIFYSRPGCHLCEDAHALVGALLARRAEVGLSVPAFVERNIEDDESWHQRYLTTIPVLAIGGSEMELATSPDGVSRFLAEALDGTEQR